MSEPLGVRDRRRWMWLGSGVAVVGLFAAAMLTIPRMFYSDPCDSALPFAVELGLNLSEEVSVVYCEWSASFPDSSGTVIVRVDDSPFREEVRRPNLDRSEQLYVATGPNGHQLRISYDEGVESGLLLTVQAIQV